MQYGLDNWVGNVDHFIKQARGFLRERSKDVLPIPKRAPIMPADENAALNTPLLESTAVQRPSSSGSAHHNSDSSDDSLIKREVAILRRVQARSNTILTPMVLMNLELAAYYMLVLMNVSIFVSCCSPQPHLRFQTPTDTRVEQTQLPEWLTK